MVIKHNITSEVEGIYLIWRDSHFFKQVVMETKKDDIMLLNEWCTSTVLYLSWHFITQQKPQYFSWNYSFENISFCYFFYIFSQNHFQKHFTFLQNYFLSQLAKLLSSQQMHDITIHYSISVLARNRWHESIGLFEDSSIYQSEGFI